MALAEGAESSSPGASSNRWRPVFWLRVAFGGIGLTLFLSAAAGTATARSDASYPYALHDPYWVDGGRLIGFLSAPYGYLANDDGTGARRVPGLMVSPDGRMTADLSLGREDYVCFFYLRKLSGKVINTIRIRGGQCWAGPVWSPDGKSVLGTLSVETATRDRDAVYRVDVGGSAHLLSRNRRLEEAPAWSPDGSHVALVSCEWPIFDPPCAIVLADRNGGGRKTLVRNFVAGRAYGLLQLVWSPDGSMLAYATPFGPYPLSRLDPPPRRWGIYVVRPDGTGLRRVARLPLMTERPRLAWSPSGGQIAFSDTRGTWSINMKTRTTRRLTTLRGALAWAPGKSILLAEEGVIYRLDPGTRPRQVLP
jgi:Tol biopolymer transport system component